MSKATTLTRLLLPIRCVPSSGSPGQDRNPHGSVQRPCPMSGARRSRSVTVPKSGWRQSAVVLYCHAGCAYADIMQILGFHKDTARNGAIPRKQKSKVQSQQVWSTQALQERYDDLYFYTDKNAQVVLCVARQNRADGKKDIRQFTPTQDGKRWILASSTSPLMIESTSGTMSLQPSPMVRYNPVGSGLGCPWCGRS